MSTVSTQQVVDAFAEIMRYKFNVRRARHGDRQDWQDTPVSRLLERLDQEMYELYDAIEMRKRGEGSDEDVIRECADVANISAMIADRHGLMDRTRYLCTVEVPDERAVK